MQFTPPTPSSRTLDSEFKRIAKHEDKTMEELTSEIEQLVNRKPREIYNWRSGKWPLPSNLIPVLCRRFKSLALLHALADECSDVVIEVPDGYDLTREVSRTVRQDLKAYESFLNAFDDGRIEVHELGPLRELMQDVIGNAHRFLDIAATDCERRNPSDHPSDHSKRSLNNPSDHALNLGGG